MYKCNYNPAHGTTITY